jgi:hypothetical protein
MDPDTPRPMTRKESALLAAFLGHDFPGAEALREQARDLLAIRGCVCGCGSISLIPQGERLPTASGHTVPVSGRVLDDDGDVVGGVVLWLEDGLLSLLEVHWDDRPIPIPEVENVQWHL